jgi:hypothetical protein
MIIERNAVFIIHSALRFQGNVISQLSFSDEEYGVKRKKTKREIFLAEMELVVPWDAMIKPIETVYPKVYCGQTCLPSVVDDPVVLHAAVVRIERPSIGRGTL